jgi:hypothetical protein
MRPPTLTSFVGGRFVFSALTIILSWQMHISAGGMKVPLWPIAIAFGFLAVVALATTNRWILLGAALIAQTFVHFGSDFAMNQILGNHHMPGSINAMMFAAHVVAAVAGWILLVHGEALFHAAQQLVIGYLVRFIAVAIHFEPQKVSSTNVLTPIIEFLARAISRRGPPLVA